MEVAEVTAGAAGASGAGGTGQPWPATGFGGRAPGVALGDPGQGGAVGAGTPLEPDISSLNFALARGLLRHPQKPCGQ